MAISAPVSPQPGTHALGRSWGIVTAPSDCLEPRGYKQDHREAAALHKDAKNTWDQYVPHDHGKYREAVENHESTIGYHELRVKYGKESGVSREASAKVALESQKDAKASKLLALHIGAELLNQKAFQANKDSAQACDAPDHATTVALLESKARFHDAAAQGHALHIASNQMTSVSDPLHSMAEAEKNIAFAHDHNALHTP